MKLLAVWVLLGFIGAGVLMNSIVIDCAIDRFKEKDYLSFGFGLSLFISLIVIIVYLMCVTYNIMT